MWWRVLALGLVGTSLVACAAILGINDGIPRDGGEGGGTDSPVGCPSGTPLFVTPSAYNNLAAQNGTAYFDVPIVGIYACPASGCVNPLAIASVSAADTYNAFALGPSVIYYTFLGPNMDGGPTGGALHSVALDGGNDTALLSNLAFPFWVATAGTNTFWIDDSLSADPPGTTPATVNCIGCSGSTSTPWITNLSVTYAMIADAHTVWVLADDGTGTATNDVYACSTTTPCVGSADAGVAATAVITGLSPPSTTPITSSPQLGAFFAGDGMYAYVVGSTSIIRTDNMGTNKVIVPAVTSVAITLDSQAGNLYFANDSTIFRTSADGTGSPVPVVCGQSGISAIAVDGANVYFVTAGNTNGAPYVAPK